ncbi:uncharacterized protein LOC132561435, partial [Ylistrum balloti]|uniref:uncharacterized protein LOC132561435 n=1 Tax=Ylistrum balloti TaxID=509963 RepID=UPI002905C37C
LPGTGDTAIMATTATSMDHIDIDILKKSVRLFVTGPRKHTVTRFEVLKRLLNGGLPGEEIVSVFRCEAPNTWFVTLQSEAVVDSIVEKGTMKDTYFALTPERCDQRRISLRVMWLPSWISDDAIADHFDSYYGKVINIAREKTSIGKVTLETGTRIVTLLIKEGDQDRIPYRDRLFGKVALITVPGRPPICLRCQQVGHVRSQCPGKPEPTTRATYAKVAQSSSQSIPGMGPTPLREESEATQLNSSTVSPSSGGSGPATSPSSGGSSLTESPSSERNSTAACPSSGSSDNPTSLPTKRPGPVIDDAGFQRVTKKGKHSSISPGILSNGDLVPGQRCIDDRSDSDMSDEDHLVIDEESG